MSKSVIKAIIKDLANAPAIAAREILEKLQTEAERDEARRIFAAVGICPEPPEKKRESERGELAARRLSKNAREAYSNADAIGED